MHKIDWETSLITEPPFTKHLSEEILLNSVCTPMEIPGYPYHTQYVERTIQLVTKAFTSVTGEEARHGFILSALTSREKCLLLSQKKIMYVKFTEYKITEPCSVQHLIK